MSTSLQQKEESFDDWLDGFAAQTSSMILCMCSCSVLCCASLGWVMGGQMNAPGSQTYAMMCAAALGLCACLSWAIVARGNPFAGPLAWK